MLNDNSNSSDSSLIVFDRAATTPPIGALALTGRDRFKLLHNMSTNSFDPVPVDTGRATVLVTALARIIDLVIAFPIMDQNNDHGNDQGEESVLLLTHAPAIVRAWLARHIFWNDQVKVQDVSTAWSILDLHGVSAAVVAEQIQPGIGAQAIYGKMNLPDGGFIARIPSLIGADSFMLVVPSATKTDWLTRLQALGTGSGTPEQHETLRVAAGMPAFGHELTEDFIPLEANLWDAVSFSKGCYIGQEILARMESRGKLAKRLVHLTLDHAITESSMIQIAGREVGTVTSVAAVANGKFVALAYLRTEIDPATLDQGAFVPAATPG